MDLRPEVGHRAAKTAPKAAPIAPQEPRWSDLFPLPTVPGPTLSEDQGVVNARLEEISAATVLLAEVKRARRDAATTWRESLAFLDSLGILAKGDRDALAEYCRARAWEALYTRRLSREGGVVRGDKGVLVVHPAARLERSYGATARALAAKLGLTPVDRGRMQLPEGGGGAEESPWDI